MKIGSRIWTLVTLFIFVLSSFTMSQSKEERKVIIEKKESGGWLGVRIENVNAKIAEKLNLKNEEGVLITHVEKNSPAEKAGLKKDDVILKFGKNDLKDSEELVDLVGKSKSGENVAVQVIRDKEKKNISVVIGQRPKNEDKLFNFSESFPKGFPFNMNVNRARIGVQLMELNPELGEYFGSPTKKGMLVKKVEKNSPAEKAGIKPGDVIIGIGKETVEDLHDITSATRDLKNGEKAELTIIRKGSEIKVPVEVEVKDNQSKDNSKVLFFHGDDGNSFEIDMQGLKEGLKMIGPHIRTMMKQFNFQGLQNDQKNINIEIEKMKPEIEKMVQEIKVKINDMDPEEIKIEIEKMKPELEKLKKELKEEMKENVIIMRKI